jgi:hypothetical protein
MSDDRAAGLGDNRLAALAADIRTAHAGVLEATKTRAGRAIVAGHALNEAKSLVRHGGWLPWLKQHCGIPERTAQLYMKLAKQADLGMGDEGAASLVAAFGMQAVAEGASLTKVVHTTGYDMFAHCDEEQRRQWCLFAWHTGAHPEHVEWLLQKQFVSPDEWLGEEGATCRQRWGMTEPSERFKRGWAAFQRQHKDMPRDAIEAELQRRVAA